MHPPVQFVTPSNWEPKGYQQITDLSSAVGLTVPDGANVAVIQCETDDVRWRDDGTDPTASIGIRLFSTATQPFFYRGDLSAIKFIEENANGALNVAYYSSIK